MQPIRRVFIDCEMTGLDVRHDRLVQIGAVCGSKSFSTFVRPTVPMTSDATRVTGITDSMLVDEPSIDVALTQFFEWIKSLNGAVILVAHSGVCSDFPFIWSEMERCDMSVVDMMATANVLWLFDTLLWARKWVRRDHLVELTGSPSCGLANLYKAITGRDPAQSHDALQDCISLKTVTHGLNLHITPNDAFNATMQYMFFKGRRARISTNGQRRVVLSTPLKLSVTV